MPAPTNDCSYESLGRGPLGEALAVCISPRHTFGVDSFLLASFSQAKRADLTADLGAGCGILSVLLYKMYQCHKIYGLELQKEAVCQFQETVSASGLENVIFPVEGDLCQLPASLPRNAFGLVVCNPPYFRENPSPNPSRAAARTEIACTLDSVCAAAERLLRFGGRFCLCQRPERLPDLFAAMRAHRLEPKRLRLAADTVSSAPWLALVEGRLGGRPGLRAEPLFFTRNPDGSSTQEMALLYKESYICHKKARNL